MEVVGPSNLEARDKLRGQIHKFWDFQGLDYSSLTLKQESKCKSDITCWLTKRRHHYVSFPTRKIRWYIDGNSRYASMPLDNIKTRMQSIGNDSRNMLETKCLYLCRVMLSSSARVWESPGTHVGHLLSTTEV